MSERLVTSDLHLGHRNILKFESEYRNFETIEEHDQALVDNWNRVVSKKDNVWVLGDVVFPSYALKRFGEMKGNKILVLGNHDKLRLQEYMKYFSSIKSIVKLEKFCLTHIPIHPCSLGRRFTANLHGHLHSRSLNDRRYFNVSVEQNHLTPFYYDDIKNYYQNLGEELFDENS